MEPDLMEILAGVGRARAAGIPEDQINASLASRLGAQGITNARQLAQAAQTQLNQPGSPVEEAQKRIAAGGGNALTDYLRMAAQGGSFDTADEALGDRQFVEDMRTLNPGFFGAANLAEMAGSALPVGGILNAVTRGAKGLRYATGAAERAVDTARGVLGVARGTSRAVPIGRAVSAGDEAVAAGRASIAARQAGIAGEAPGALRAGLSRMGQIAKPAALTGGTVGALQGAGDAEGGLGPRLQGAATGGVLGALLGTAAATPFALIGGVRASNEARRTLLETSNARLGQKAEDLLPEAGLQRTRGALTDEIAGAKKTVQREHFAALDAAPPVRDSDLMTFLSHSGYEEVVEDALRRGTNSSLEQVRARGLTFPQIQNIGRFLQDEVSSSLERGLPNRAIEAQKHFNTYMRKVDDLFPNAHGESWTREARHAWRNEMVRERAMAAGHKAINMSDADITKVLAEGFTEPDANAAFRLGLARRLIDNIDNRTGPVKLSQGQHDRFRLALGSEEAYAKFVNALDVEDAVQRRALMENALIGVVGLLGGGTSLLGRAIIGM